MEPTDTLVRAARELLRWDQHHLAKKAKISVVTLRRFETGAAVEEATLLAIERALQKAGVAFFKTEPPAAPLQYGIGLTAVARPRPRPKPRVYKKREPKEAPG